jgi:hypothetical protein
MRVLLSNLKDMVEAEKAAKSGKKGKKKKGGKGGKKKGKKGGKEKGGKKKKDPTVRRTGRRWLCWWAIVVSASAAGDC